MDDEITTPEDVEFALGMIDNKERVKRAMERILREQLRRKRGHAPRETWPRLYY